MNKSFFLGAAVAVGAVMLIPGVAVALGRAGRPIVRAGMRTGAVAFDEFRKAGAEAYESMEDIIAEVREEMEAERAEGETEPEAAGTNAG
ncbi:DUF5132 domain-containing protein [Thalassovita mangrovi]|uniref:DUF5132 domain-containing protein n=1 Tax=Thalassovita mangrovi TaxID=2692236 RepID=A0A6L8LGG3_9RHOB|nr:DUF5132 domain-containing protein [Thalassovita mangrovi]MYM55197.1 DUF5132 domain-containing protein [Thalassovita mangrovi]